ncbi:MAG: RecQ family ATP-dependent DNA helicase, partial [Salibacteraceae bacterium]
PLKKYFGFDQFKGDQEQIIQSVLSGKDTFVIMPTGGGKSLTYQLPALIEEGTAIVISPLIALMKNQVDALRAFVSNDSAAHYLNSSLSRGDAKRVKEDLVAGVTKILFVAPESLNKQDNVDFFKTLKISFVAVDEAHCISEWGHDFRPEYRRIREMIKQIDDSIPIMALTATATPKVQLDIQKNLGMTDANLFKASFNRPNLYYEVLPKIHPEKQIIKYIKENLGKSGIIYCLSRKKVEEVAETLQVNGISALPYHAGMEASRRAKYQDMFLMEDVDIIVATIAFGMGIDKPDVRFVMHYDIPKSLEGYYQETGRAGRDGGEGRCIAYYDYKDIEKLEKFMAGKPVAEQEVGKQLLHEVVAYAETAMSRRKFLLHYFGEDWDETKAGKDELDDNLVNPKEKQEAKKEMAHLFQVISDLKGQFKTKQIIEVLIGKESPTIKANRLNTNVHFGSGKEHSDKFWMAAVRQGFVNNYIGKKIEEYGTLFLTDLGKDFLAKPSSFKLIIDHDYDELMKSVGNNVVQKGGAAGDTVLFGMLKDLRKEIGHEKGLPPFVIFQDPSLQDMATQYPITMEEMQNIVGVGQGKAAKFGARFIDLIDTYVKENEIERPQDVIVKQVANKSATKIAIIQGIDKKIPLSDLARTRSMTDDEFITEIENIVASGTKVNIDYYINDVLDEDYQEEIVD